MKKFLVLLLTLALLTAGTALAEAAETQNPVATITMADGGVITVELYPDVAPNTVANFV